MLRQRKTEPGVTAAQPNKATRTCQPTLSMMAYHRLNPVSGGCVAHMLIAMKAKQSASGGSASSRAETASMRSKKMIAIFSLPQRGAVVKDGRLLTGGNSMNTAKIQTHRLRRSAAGRG